MKRFVTFFLICILTVYSTTIYMHKSVDMMRKGTVER